MNNDLLTRIRSAFQSTVRNPHSNFYRDLYGVRAMDPEFPRSFDDWHDLPLLSKQDILRVPFYERIFVPLRRLDYARTTSGTTRSGVLSLPRVKDSPDAWQGRRLARGLRGAKVLLTFFPFHTRLTHELIDTTILAGDPARMEMTARFAAQLHVDALHGSPSALLAFAPILETTGYPLQRIRAILTSMERLNSIQALSLKKIFPDAPVTSAYGNTEQQGHGAFSPEIPVPGYPFALEPTPDFYYEIIGEDGASVTEIGIPGELVTTNLGKGKAFPIIRYRSGDRAMFVRSDPAAFIVLGRIGGDRVRVQGGEIVLEEIERVLADFPCVRDFEGTVEDGPDSLPRLMLNIVVAGSTAPDIEALRLSMSRNMRVNQNRSYQDGVEKGIYAPLEIRMMRTTPTPLQKKKGLTDARA